METLPTPGDVTLTSPYLNCSFGVITEGETGVTVALSPSSLLGGLGLLASGLRGVDDILKCFE